MVLPGFHDSHLHPISGGMRALSCSLVDARTIDAILAKVRECAARPRSDAQGWLIGAGWDLSLFPAANPHRSLLDAVVPDRPVFLEGADGHSAWVNSRALAIAGIDRSTPDPRNGVIERDRSSGEPSGTLRESAAALVSSRLPPPSAEDRRAGLRHALQSAASFGITAMIDPGVDQDDFDTYQTSRRGGRADRAGARLRQAARVRAGVHGSSRRRSRRPASPRPTPRAARRWAGVASTRWRS